MLSIVEGRVISLSPVFAKLFSSSLRIPSGRLRFLRERHPSKAQYLTEVTEAGITIFSRQLQP